ncbi:MAG: serine/threonine-protein phosphatase [Chloroflexia bacterium]|nr:serine/threonine-protein phosphatase [Chloroflexia bacterium]
MSLVPAEFNLSVGSATSPAGRPNNEDAILVKSVPSLTPGDTGGMVLAVADGMGGHEKGEVASQLAISLLEDLFARDAPDDVALALKQAYRRANEAIYNQSPAEQDDSRMGTTLVSAVVRGKYATIANVGDSRAYLIRSRQLTQITQDHSLVAEQVAKGVISEEESRMSPQRNIVTQALGLSETLDRRMPSIYEITLLPEDRLLLCSDGFFDVLQTEDYVTTILGGAPQDSVLALTSMAIERGTTDNVSAIVLEVSPSLATVQREQIGTEIAAGAPRLSPLLVPIVLILFLILAIVAGVYFYL